MKKLVTTSPLPAQQQKFLQDNTATLDKTAFSWILSNTFSSSSGFFLFVGFGEKKIKPNNKTKHTTTIQCTFAEIHPNTHPSSLKLNCFPDSTTVKGLKIHLNLSKRSGSRNINLQK